MQGDIQRFQPLAIKTQIKKGVLLFPSPDLFVFEKSSHNNE